MHKMCNYYAKACQLDVLQLIGICFSAGSPNSFSVSGTFTCNDTP